MDGLRSPLRLSVSVSPRPHGHAPSQSTSMKNTRAIIFDLDGTLFDLDPLVQAARKRVARHLYVHGFFASESYALSRINDLELRHGPYYSSSPYYFAFYDVAKALQRDKPDRLAAYINRQRPNHRSLEDTDSIEAFVAELEYVYNSEAVEDVKLFPGAVQTLQELRGAGCQLFLVTFGRTLRQKNKIDLLNIAPYFHRIVNQGPPSHDYWFAELIKDHKFSPEEVVCVGDRAKDEIRAGNRLGCTTVWMRRGRYAEEEPGEGDRPTHQIRLLPQLSTLIHLARMDKDPRRLKVAALGGGTGLPIVLRGIQTYTDNPTAVVAVTDTGASSGRIRWNLGVQPPGDIRNALTALADRRRVSHGLTRVFQHRFPDSEREAGIFRNDNIGNFLIAALTQQLGDFQKAIQTAGDMLRIRGEVFPATNQNVDICAELENGEQRYTEWMVRKTGKSPLKHAYLVANGEILRELQQPGGALYRKDDSQTGQVEVHARPGRDFCPARNEARAPRGAVQAIADADIVVLGPGSLFTSVITNLLVPDIRRALCARHHGKTFYVCNIVTQPGQTDRFSASDHLRAILRHFQERHSGFLDHMLVQDPEAFHSPGGRKWRPVLNAYLNDGKEPVSCDPDEIRPLVTCTVTDLLEDYTSEVKSRRAGDFISHNPDRVADAVCRIYCGLEVPDYGELNNGSAPD